MSPQQKNDLETPVSSAISLPGIMNGHRNSDFLDPLIALASRKFFIIYAVLIACVGALLLGALLPKSYTAEARMLPPQQGQSFASSMLDQVGALAPFLGAAGKDLLKNNNDLYVAMLHSRTVADHIVDRFSLMGIYGKALREDARKRLGDHTEIVARKDGIISISVEDRDPNRAANMANAYIEELGKLTKTLAVTDASRRKIFFEGEARTAADELATAELELKQTEERTGVFEPESQTKVVLESYASLKAQATAKEVEIQSMRSFAAPDNPDLVRAEEELWALRSQLTRYEEGQGGRPIEDVALEKVPAKALEYVRKLRDVRYREALWQLLLKQYEIARIDEGKETAIIQPLDSAIAPEKKSWPKLWILVSASAFVAFFTSVLWVFLAELVSRSGDDPHFLIRLQLLKFYLVRRTDRS